MKISKYEFDKLPYLSYNEALKLPVGAEVLHCCGWDNVILVNKVLKIEESRNGFVKIWGYWGGSKVRLFIRHDSCKLLSKTKVLDDKSYEEMFI